jgi:hypothetical protein
MTRRLASGVLVSALLRRVHLAGGSAVVLSKGDETAGSIVVVAAEKGRITGLSERILDSTGRYLWASTGPQDIDNIKEIDEYLARRRSRDPDLWVIELDVAGAAQFAAQLDGTA